ncbi:MAG: hypothetical protein E6Q37_02465 [Crocinitomicaceae bacterium]|nr:MAG: hypothetical protein E6Q37_02465 [Crocinitomicaceae bacterium]
MFFRVAIVCCWVVCASVVPNPSLRPVFGVQVRPQTGSNMFTFVAFLDNGRELTYRKILNTDDFVRIASGHWPSIYNPTRENLLEKNRIACGMFNDSIHLKLIPYCFATDSLWKIRFSEYPFNNGSGKGWAGDYSKPSARQALYLKENYKVDNVDHNYFLDTNFWKIMRDIQDTAWIAHYKSLK